MTFLDLVGFPHLIIYSDHRKTVCVIQKLLDQHPDSVKNLQDVHFLFLELLSHFALYSDSVATLSPHTQLSEMLCVSVVWRSICRKSCRTGLGD